MKERIYKSLLLLSLAALIMSTIASEVLYYKFYKKQTDDDLMIQCEALVHGLNGVVQQNSDRIVEFLKNYRQSADQNQKARVTLIEKDGTVLYDSVENVREMENHASRPEVQEALQEGNGAAERTSDTIGQNTYYCAVVSENGDYILRLSRETSNMFGIFLQMLPFDILACLILFVLSIFATKRITNRILGPLNAFSEQLRKGRQISYENQCYNELKPFLNSVQEAQRVREEFTANVSHELKTPLTSISGFAEMIESGMVTDVSHLKEFSGTIHKEAQRLLSLIDDIMHLSKIEEGKMACMEPMNLKGLLLEIEKRLSLKAEKHGIEILLESEDAPVLGNRTMLDEMIYNLVDNSIKYNHRGGYVKVSCGITEKEDKKHSFLMVEDNGIGIPHSDRDRIFERFYRVDKSHSRATGGTGLGLSIVKHVAEQHKAEISLDSELGKGTRILVLF